MNPDAAVIKHYMCSQGSNYVFSIELVLKVQGVAKNEEASTMLINIVINYCDTTYNLGS